MWYALAYSSYEDGPGTDLNSWVPSNVRMTFGAFQNQNENYLVLQFYENTNNSEK